jgi:hypothetical protein
VGLDQLRGSFGSPSTFSEEVERMTLSIQDIAVIAIAIALWLIFLFGINVA